MIWSKKMKQIDIGDTVLDEATGEKLFYLDAYHRRWLTLVTAEGSARLAERDWIVESAAGFRVPAKCKMRMRVGVKTKLREESERLERKRLKLSFSASVPPFTVARLVELLAGNRLSIKEYFEAEPGEVAEAA